MIERTIKISKKPFVILTGKNQNAETLVCQY